MFYEKLCEAQPTAVWVYYFTDDGEVRLERSNRAAAHWEIWANVSRFYVLILHVELPSFSVALKVLLRLILTGQVFVPCLIKEGHHCLKGVIVSNTTTNL